MEKASAEEGVDEKQRKEEQGDDGRLEEAVDRSRDTCVLKGEEEKNIQVPKGGGPIEKSEDPVEEGLRAVITVAFAGALMAYGSGVEPILGSFMGGLIFSFVFKSKGRFEEKINAVGFGFFIPFFFIGVGADFDIKLLMSLQGIAFSTFLTVMVFVGNLFPLFFARFLNRTVLEAFGMSLLLSAPLSLIVVAGTLGEKMNMITGEMAGSLILAAIFSGILYPFLFRIVSRKIMASAGQESRDA